MVVWFGVFYIVDTYAEELHGRGNFMSRCIERYSFRPLYILFEMKCTEVSTRFANVVGG